MKGDETERVTSKHSDNHEEDGDENREHVEGIQNYIQELLFNESESQSEDEVEEDSEAPKTAEDAIDVYEAATKAVGVIDQEESNENNEEEDPKEEGNYILNASDNKDINLSENNIRFNKEDQLLKKMIVTENTENNMDREKEK